MDFPAWAPKALCVHYHYLCSPEVKELQEKRLSTGEERVIPGVIELLKRLLTDEDMMPVWRAYRKEFPQDLDLSITKDEVFPFIVQSHRSSMEKREPWNEVTDKIEEVSKKAKDLARSIKNTAYDLSASLFLTYLDHDLDHEIHQKLWAKIGSDEALNSALNSLTISTLLKYISEGANYDLQVRRLVEKNSRDLLNTSSFQYVPNPRAKNAQANRLIRELSLLLRLHLGGPRTRLLTRLVRVVLQPQLDEDENMDIDETMVDGSLKEWRKTYPHLKEWFKQPGFIRTALSMSSMLS